MTIEDQVGEIIDVLANTETTANQIRAAEEQLQREADERHRIQAIEWRRQEEEKQRRKVLEECSDQWHRARRLRFFIRACEKELQTTLDASPVDSQAAKWLHWAREHADSIDPIKTGWLRNLKETQQGVAS